MQKAVVRAGYQFAMKSSGTVVDTPENGYRQPKAPVKLWLLTLLVIGWSLMACAQTTADEKNTPAPSPKSDFSLPPVDLKSLPRNLFVDQKSFWSTPFHMT